MADVTMTLAEARRRGRVDCARVAATTEAEIRRQMVADGENPDAPDAGWFPAPAGVRHRLGLTQPQMAGLLRIPVATWRNWEQNRVRIEPASQALLRILWREPEAARRALSDRAA